MPTQHKNVEACVADLIARVGPEISIAMPLGLGKPTALINALYRKAREDQTLRLRILTALSLQKPRGSSALEKAFLTPFVERVYGDCPELEYVQDLAAGKLPPNVEVIEFFFKPGSRLNNVHAQQHYVSSNYTHAARDVFEQGCNVAAQLVCKREQDGETRYSLSANPDTSPELLALLRASGRKHVVVAEVNQNLPFMQHDAEVAGDEFDLILDHPSHSTTLFSTPKLPVSAADYAIGLQASALIQDGGTLQIGIGALGDALVHATCLRQQNNEQYQQLLQLLSASDAAGLIDCIGGREPFEKGLYGATEMFVDGFMALYDAGVLKRKVYDNVYLQRLLNSGEVGEKITPELLDLMQRDGERVIRTQEFEVLRYHGVFRDDCDYDAGYIVAPDGERIMANLAIPESRAKLQAKCLGDELRNGVLLHGGFFLGPQDFYTRLREMSDAERAQFSMTGVYKINQLDHNPDLYKAQRVNARFINTGLMATLNGAVASDGLEDGRVLSGVGGQYNFVAMAHHLLTGRSILMVRAVREQPRGAVSSNIVMSYGHCTIPRHLRDIVISEYGIADLRSKTDAQVAEAMIQIADSRFQDDLIAQAKNAGRLAADFELAPEFRNNTPQRLAQWLGSNRAALPAYPLGCDFTEHEQVLAAALGDMKSQLAGLSKWGLLIKAWRAGQPPKLAEPYLERMALRKLENLQQWVSARLLSEALARQQAVKGT